MITHIIPPDAGSVKFHSNDHSKVIAGSLIALLESQKIYLKKKKTL